MFLKKTYKRAIILVFLLSMTLSILLLRSVWTRHEVRENTLVAGEFSGIFRQEKYETLTHLRAMTSLYVTQSLDSPSDATEDRIPVGEFQRYPLDVNLKEVVLKIQGGEAVSIAPINQYKHSALIGSGCDRDLPLVYIIKSHPRNTDSRMAIRQTWGNETNLRQAKRLFVVGTTTDNDTQPKLCAENAMFNDLLQGDFLDFYHNTGTKMEFAIHWAVTNCSHVRYLVFLDDDVLVNPRALIKFLESKKCVKSADFTWVGLKEAMYLNETMTVDIIEDYPLLNYPPLTPAGTYVLNQALAREVVIAMQLVKKIKFDDVYLALVMRKLGVPPFHTDLIDLIPLGYEHSKRRTFISMLGEFSPNRLKEAWIELQRIHYSRASSCTS